MSSVQSRREPVADPALEAVHRRYRDDQGFAPSGWNPVLELLLAHRSVRAFAKGPLPEGTLETLIAAAQSAPSSSNLQLWSVVTIEDPAARASLAAWAGNQKHVAEAPLFLIFLADLSRAARVAERVGAEPKTLDLVEPFVVGVVDAALAAQNAVVAAESLGLGSVYIGALRNRIEAVAELIDLPPRVVPLFGLAIGRPDPAVATDVKPRLPQRAIVHRERYRIPDDEPALVESYDGKLRAFQAEQKLPPIDWSKQQTTRVSDITALNGREALRTALARFGFKLD